MSEYICELEDARYEMEWAPKEEIVRCRDCVNFTYGSSEGHADDWCSFHNHIGWSTNGFCAWGERRDDAE